MWCFGRNCAPHIVCPKHHISTDVITLQQTATAATHCNTLQHTAPHIVLPKHHISTTLQHTATHCIRNCAPHIVLQGFWLSGEIFLLGHRTVARCVVDLYWEGGIELRVADRLFSRDVGLFCGDVGLFCGDVGLFCGDVGLFRREYWAENCRDILGSNAKMQGSFAET